MDAATLVETWREVVNSPHLRDLPFRLELNEAGKVEFAMSPATNRHSYWQFRIGVMLERALGGEALVECSILTGKGVKVADVVWCSPAFLARHGYETPYTQAPELCVEVTSPSNTTDELNEKVRLYLEAGAVEAWIVHEDGVVELYGSEGRRRQSVFGIAVAPLGV
ncbi:MAG: Uma2 family endonuclease [Candidatus Contendobacter sp.]|nr:Uma2 family endonuclease [Candidatus Contendobacter sp.]MDG4557740.1 Uma2 family endonuclease [Candidatus Contendobacter sp.]